MKWFGMRCLVKVVMSFKGFEEVRVELNRITEKNNANKEQGNKKDM